MIVLNTIILFGAIQGLISSAILFLQRERKLSSKLLAGIIFFLSLACLNIFLMLSGLPDQYRFIETLGFFVPLTVAMPLGPLVYFYQRSIDDPQTNIDKRHFLPIVFDLLPYALGACYVLSRLSGEENRQLIIYMDIAHTYVDIPRWLSLSIYLTMAARRVFTDPGSSALIVNATSAHAAFTPDQPGIYTVALTITNSKFADTDEIHVMATATDNPDESQTILIENDVTQERVLEDVFTDPVRPDYIVTTDVRVSATVTVRPGVIIEFEQDKGMQIMFDGALVAEGTTAEPITFTGTQKQSGYWKGLLFASNNSANSLKHVTVEYGASSAFAESPRANISIPGDAISGGVVNISNSIIRNSGGYGIYAGGMSFIPAFTEMNVTGNAGSAIYCSPRNISQIDPNTIFSGNGFNGVETGGLLQEGSLVSWYPLTSGAYKVSSDLTIASALEIEPGTAFKIAKDVMITIAEGARLTANGTAAERILFEGTSSISENAWRGIVVHSHLENSIDYADIRNAGHSDLPRIVSGRASIGVSPGARLTITNSSVDKSGGWGITLESGSLYNENIHTSNTFIATALGSVRFPVLPQPVNIAGEWVEYESLLANQTIDKDFYNRETGQWFKGADHPWAMSPKTAFGITIDASGNYVWIIAMMHSPMTECFTYSAEHFTGKVTADGELLHFVEESWRSKYFNSCDAEGNKDFDVEPGQMELQYAITKEYNAATGQEHTVLNITSGGETFKLYKR
jgi:PKD repeat protein